MKKICIALIMTSIFLVAFTIPCGADLESRVSIVLKYFGPVYDINHDGIIDGLDVSLIVYHYNAEGNPGWIREDIDKSGRVDGSDVSILVYHYDARWLIP